MIIKKIWFKVYLVDALTHLFPTYSRYVYVELISPNDTLVSRVMIRPENGLFYGHIFISEMLPEGNYTLRAYTLQMENLGDDYFFKKNIRIGNIASSLALSEGEGARRGESNERNLISRGNRGRMSVGTTLAVAPNDYDVAFFPEGGNLVEGVFCKVTLKALNRDGTSASISGELIDETGTAITSVKTLHAGMGFFTFIPNEGKRYFLQCRNGNGLEKQFDLPPTDPRAYALTTLQRNNMVMVGIRKSPQHQEIPCYLLGHCRGMVFHFASWDNLNEPIAFPEESLPAGVLQFMLFDEQINPLSERLVFNKNYELRKIDFQTDKASYEKRGKVVATLSLSDITPLLRNEGKQLNDNAIAAQSVNLSLTITDDSDLSVDSTTTILSSLLLSSELKGYIENPAWYLQDNIESATALDYLMMTHGWRRYNIPEAVKGNPAYPQIPFQESQQISGKVKTLALSRPVADSEILIMVKDGDFGITTTDEKGIFSYDDFEYPDSTSYFIQALNKRGSNNVELVLNKETFPKPIYAPQSMPVEKLKSAGKTSNDSTLSPLPLEEGRREFDNFIAKAEQRANYDEDIRLIHLSEVLVTAQRIERKDEPRLQFWANDLSDVTIRREDIEKTAPMLVSDWLRNIPGVGVNTTTGDISIRGGSPLVLINGMPVDWLKPSSNSNEPPQPPSPYDSPLETVSVHDVESIDIFKGVSAAMFGVRGSGGVISITTKKGVDNSIRESEALNYTVYTPLGYQKPIEFYSPKYETLESKHLSVPDYRTTIFWKPDIFISEDKGQATFEFYASDFPTTYSVVIEGITTDGQLIRQVEKIRVE